MGIKLRKHGTVTATFATAQQVDISHANDSIRVGDGTDLMGPLQNVGGVLCYPVSVQEVAAGTLALDATLTGGTQRTKITDGADNVGIEDVGGEKALKVAVISTVGGGAAPAHTDDAAFNVGTDQLTPIGAMFDDTATDSVDEGDVGVVRMTADRLLKTQIAGIAGSVAIPVTDNGGSLTIDNTNIDAALSTLATQATLAEIEADTDAIIALLTTIDADTGNISTKIDTLAGAVSGTEMQVDVLTSALPSGASTSAKQDTMITALQLIDDVVFTDDAAFTPATSKVAAIGATFDDTATDTVDEGDIGALRMTAYRGLHVSLRYPGDGSAVFDQQTMANSIPVAIASNQSNVPVAGPAAHDAAVSGNPVRIAGRAMLANGTAVAEDDTADIATDNQGRLVITPHVPRDLTTHGTATLTNTTETTLLAAVASTFLDIVKLVFTNSSSTATRVALKDSTTGTTRIEVALAANGGAVIDFGAVPLTQATVNNNWTVTLSGAVTSVYCFAQAIKRIA